MRKAVYSMGHGGRDCGSIGYDRHTERWRIRELAEDIDKLVPVTLREEKDSSGEWKYTNGYGFSYKGSLHFNCFNKKARGVEVCYKKASQKGHAERLSQELALAMGIPNRGAKYRSDLYMMNIGFDFLIEVCFHDNPKDLAAFKKHRNSVVDILVCAIEEHLGIEYSKHGYEKKGKPGVAQYLPKTTISKTRQNPKDILRLQKFFIWLGYNQKITKKYDEATIKNILKFQEKYNLTEDGVFGLHCRNRAKKVRER